MTLMVTKAVSSSTARRARDQYARSLAGFELIDSDLALMSTWQPFTEIGEAAVSFGGSVGDESAVEGSHG